jgi:hypothetical protein
MMKNMQEIMEVFIWSEANLYAAFAEYPPNHDMRVPPASNGLTSPQ